MPFADELIGPATARRLADAIGAAAGMAVPALDAAAQTLGDLALRERADLLRDALLDDIAGDYRRFADIVRTAHRSDPDFTGWLLWPVTCAVATKAVDEGTDGVFDDAMALLADLTGGLTSEFAIRILLRHNLDRALATIATWTSAPDAAVRRLASEGTRPYLPWSLRVPGIIARPGVTVPLLDALYRDSSQDVRRSVANHVNDLGRDHAELAVELAARWLAAPDEHTAAVIRHGLRTLVKRGHPGALEILGFAPASITVDGPTVDPARIPMGGSVRFSATILNVGDEPARLAIDYVVHHRKANGTLSPKTFKLTTATLPAGDAVDVAREHSFRPITTRRYHAGTHAISLQVNGVMTEPAVFELDPAPSR